MTDIYDDLYTLLHADDWSNYGSEPPIFDSGIVAQDSMNGGNYIYIFPRDVEDMLTTSGTIAYQVRMATITIVAITKQNRDNMVQDVKDALSGSSYYLTSEPPINAPDLYIREIEVKNIK